MKTKPRDPEVLDAEEGATPVDVSTTALAEVTRGEVSSQVQTARQYPRSVTKFMKEAEGLATLNEDTAASCIYALPRGRKTVEGPSARFAELVRYSWGNLRVQSMVVAEEAEFVVVRALAWDMEKNVALGADVKRRITDSKGVRYNADMIGVTTAAASVIAERNVTLRQIPKALWEPIYLKARHVIAGDAKTLSVRRQAMLEHFMKLGVRNEQVFTALAIGGADDITLDHMVTLRGFATAIKEGTQTIEQIFSEMPGESAPATQVSADIVAEYLKDVDADLAVKILAGLEAKGLNLARTSVLLKKYAGKPMELLAEVTRPAEEVAEQKKKAPAEKVAEKKESVTANKAETKDDESF